MQHLNATRRRRPRLTVTGLILALCAGVAAAASDSPAEVRAVIEQLRALPLPRIQVTGREESHPGGRGLLPALEQRRQRIYEELHALGPRALPALGRALRARDLSMRRHVVVALDVLSARALRIWVRLGTVTCDPLRSIAAKIASCACRFGRAILK